MTHRKKASPDPIALMGQVAKAAGDKRFLGQLAGVQSSLVKEDWRGVTLGSRMLYRIAQEGGYLEKILPVLSPFFEAAKTRFEQARVARVQLRRRILISSRKVAQLLRLSTLFEVM